MVPYFTEWLIILIAFSLADMCGKDFTIERFVM